MSITPFHDLADQLDIIADQVRVLGDTVHAGTYTVPTPPPEDPEVDPPSFETVTDLPAE